MSKNNPPRVILGPFTATPHEPEDDILSWGFITIREDHSVQWVQLHFNIKKRSFYTSSSSNSRFYVSEAYESSTIPKYKRRAQLNRTASYFKDDEDLTSQNGGMFLGGNIPEPIPGLLRDLLRMLLKSEDIAKVTALAIETHKQSRIS